MDVSSLTEHHKMQTQEWCQHRSTITKQQPRMHGMMHGMITYTIIEDLEFSGFPSSRSKALAGLSRGAIDQTHKITTASLFTPCLSSESSKHHKPSKRSQMGGDLAFCNPPRKKEQNTCSSSRSCLLLGLLLEPFFPCPESGITMRETGRFSIFFPPPFPLRETQSLLKPKSNTGWTKTTTWTQKERFMGLILTFTREGEMEENQSQEGNLLYNPPVGTISCLNSHLLLHPTTTTFLSCLLTVYIITVLRDGRRRNGRWPNYGDWVYYLTKLFPQDFVLTTSHNTQTSKHDQEWQNDTEREREREREREDRERARDRRREVAHHRLLYAYVYYTILHNTYIIRYMYTYVYHRIN